MATEPNFKGREQLFKNKGKDVDVSLRRDQLRSCETEEPRVQKTRMKLHGLIVDSANNNKYIHGLSFGAFFVGRFGTFSRQFVY